MREFSIKIPKSSSFWGGHIPPSDTPCARKRAIGANAPPGSSPTLPPPDSQGWLRPWIAHWNKMRKGAVIKSYIYPNNGFVKCHKRWMFILFSIDMNGNRLSRRKIKLFRLQIFNAVYYSVRDELLFFRKTWNKLKVIVKENMSKWPGIIIMSKHGFLKCHECWMFILSSMIWMLIECEGGKLCCSSFRFQLQLLEMCKAAWANSFLLCVPTWVNEADDVVQWPNEILLVLCST